MHRQINQADRPERNRPLRPLKRFADEARFLRSWVENPIQTGAVSPSGRSLARMMARYVDPASRGPVIELGPGTGPVTQALIRRGIAQERLILVEFDPDFCRLLARRFPRARIVLGDAYDLPRTLAGVLTEPAASIVSSLPLLMKPDPQRVALLRDAFAMMAPGGRFVQFTYGMVSPIPRRAKGAPFVTEASPAVWLNLPPARVFAYQAAGESAAARIKQPGHDFISKVKIGAGRMRDELRERTGRMHSEIKLATARARDDLGHRAPSKTTKIAPTLNLLEKLGEGKRPPKQ